MNPANATPHATLLAELMNPNNPKNEREHAAVREIERLREDQQGVDAVNTLTEEGWIWDGDQWQRPALQSAWLLESTQTLAKTLARDFYPEVTQWECLDDLAGVISQIDNMTTGLMRKPKKESTGCACQWNFEGDRVVTCARHEGWLEVIVEWADRARDAEKKLKSIAQLEPFKPDWNTEAVLVEEMQRMAKRIEDLETEQDCVGWFGYDTGLRLWFETNKGDDGAIPLYKEGARQMTEPFKPDWNTQAVLFEDAIQRMTAELKESNEKIKKLEKIIADQDALLERQTARIVDLKTHIENLEGEE